jgi:uncharacterized protein
MIRKRSFRHILFIPIIAIMFSAGCAGSALSRFYALNPLGAVDTTGKNISQWDTIIVAVGPVHIPDYLDRPQIVTRTGMNELMFAEFDRWPGSLKQDIVRVILDNLSTLLYEKQISVTPWKRAIPSVCRVALDISAFDIYINDHVILKANWVILDNDGKKVVAMKDASYREPLKGNDYNTAVAAMSKCLINLSLGMAETITGTISKGNYERGLVQ